MDRFEIIKVENLKLILFFIALIHRVMSNADGLPHDIAAGPLIKALFGFNCFE